MTVGHPGSRATAGQTRRTGGTSRPRGPAHGRGRGRTFAGRAPFARPSHGTTRATVASSRMMVRLVHLMVLNRTIVPHARFRCAVGAPYSPQPHKKRPFAA